MKQKLKSYLIKILSNKIFYYFLIVLISSILFICIYGVHILNPLYIDWLIEGDLAADYIGIKAYIHDIWRFPLGLTNQVAYPSLSWVGFSLLALPLKIFRGILPENFQFFGIWGLITFQLMGFFSLKLIMRFEKNNWLCLIGAIFGIIPTVLLQRMFAHTTLQPQWLIIWIFDLCYCIYKKCSNNKSIIIQIISISLISVTTQFYFFPMCIIPICVICLWDIINTKKFYSLLKYFLPYFATGIFIIGIIGGFSTISMSIVDSGFGTFSSNLNKYLNPMNFSLIFNQIACGSGQYEGAAYLGLGLIILSIISTISFFVFFDFKNYFKNNKKFLIISLIFFLLIEMFATSNVVRLNDTIIMEIKLPNFMKNLLGAFRSSGRFIWINFYLILFFSLFILLNSEFKKEGKFNYKYSKFIILPICLIIQLVDLSGYFSISNNKFNKIISSNDIIDDKNFWNLLKTKNLKHCCLTFDFEKQIGTENEAENYKLSEQIIRQNYTINTFNYGRYVGSFNNNFNYYISEKLEDTFYISRNESILSISNLNLNHYYIDNYYISTYKTIEGYNTVNPTFSYTFNNSYVTNGYDVNNNRILNPLGISYGPFIYMGASTHSVTISGKNFGDSTNNNIVPSFTSDNRNLTHNIEIKKFTDNEVIFEVSLNSLYKDCEIIIFNNSINNVLISSIVCS